jgi:hypothetical protein
MHLLLLLLRWLFDIHKLSRLLLLLLLWCRFVGR